MRYADQYLLFEKYFYIDVTTPVQQKIQYNILTYKSEAYCELSRIDKAYETMQDLIKLLNYD